MVLCQVNGSLPWKMFWSINVKAEPRKVPLLFSIMLLPLIFNGAGKISLDHLLAKWLGLNPEAKISDFATAGLALMVIGAPLVFLLPGTGWALILVGAGFLIANRAITPSD